MLLAMCCGCGDASSFSTSTSAAACGPAMATVARVVDGDTLDLSTGDRVRILGVDAPELHGDECYANEAAMYLRDLAEHQEVALAYDEAACRDRYGRLLAHVETPDGDAATLLVSRGYACAFYVPPAGQDRKAEIAEYELSARGHRRGLWGQCSPLPECAQ